MTPPSCPPAPSIQDASPGAQAPTAASRPAEAPSGSPIARLVAIEKDGSDGRIFPVVSESVDIGRLEGDILLPDDPYLSPRHARLLRRGQTWFLRDLDSLNGCYIRIREPVELRDGDVLLVGQQVLRFEVLKDGESSLGPASMHGTLIFGTPEIPRVARLVQYTTEGIGRDVHHVHRDETLLGREAADVVFSDDPFLSRRHAAIAYDRSHGRFVLRDLGSSNGTSIRFRGERALLDGDQFRVGRHLFRFECGAGARR
ncbi:MAG: FHA domain-containing protein [Myxococcota bacterium]|nr:FHA domain-containing protein [Myxococcota bacterium]